MIEDKLQKIDNIIFEVCCNHFKNNIQSYDKIKNIGLFWLNKLYPNIDILQNTKTQDNENVIDFISLKSNNFTLYKYLSYYYQNDNNEYFTYFVFKVLRIFSLILTSCFLQETGTYLSHQSSNTLNKISLVIKLFRELIFFPLSKYYFYTFTNNCCNNLVKKISSNILNEKKLLSNEVGKISDLNFIIQYGHHRLNNDILYSFIIYVFDIIIRTFFIAIDTYRLNIHKNILARILSIFSIFGISLSNLITTLAGNFSLKVKNKQIGYQLEYNKINTYIENIVKSKDSLTNSKFNSQIICNLSKMFNDINNQYNKYMVDYCIISTFRNGTSYIWSIISMYLFGIKFSPATFTFQEKIVKDTQDRWVEYRQIMYTVCPIIDNYIIHYNVKSDLEEKYHHHNSKYAIQEILDQQNIHSITNIKIDNISFTYYDKYLYRTLNIFDNYSLNLDKKGMTVILGESGKGKTTLLNIISGLIIPDKGQIILNNKHILNSNTFEIKDYITYMTQRTYLFDEKSILFNITFNEHLSDTENQNLTIIIGLCELTELINKIGLSYIINNHPSNLSEGQKKRVCLARSLYEFKNFNKSVFIADEPTTGLEPASSEKIVNNLSKYYANSSKIIIIGLHNGIIKKENTYIRFVKL